MLNWALDVGVPYHDSDPDILGHSFPVKALIEKIDLCLLMEKVCECPNGGSGY